MKKNLEFCPPPLITGGQKIWRIMKISTFLILVFTLASHGGVLSQTTSVGVEKKSMSLRDFLKEIKVDSEFRVIYNNDLVKDDIMVDVEYPEAQVSEVLGNVLKKASLAYKLEDGNIVIFPVTENVNLQQQTKTIKGLVLDSNGDVLPGASIMEQGTDNGVVADENGKFTISVKPDADVLVVSFIGMTSKIVNINGRDHIEVILSSNLSALEEVVVVGYGTQKKVDVTGAISTVKAEDIVKDNATSITHTLAGKVAGVITVQSTGQPGVDAGSFSIRGQSTFGNNNALVLVDGVPRSWHRIDPSEIESFVVLKDAASTAIYGARAANGVVLITTKRGKKGKVTINYKGSYSVQTVTKKPEIMNAYQYAKYFNEARKNSGDNPRFTEEEIEKYRTGAEGYEGTDWWDECVDKYAPKKDHTLSVSGGTDKVKYFISTNYMKQEGLLSITNFERYGLRSNIDINLAKGLQLSIDMNYRLEKRKESGSSDGAGRVWYMIMESQPTSKAWVNKEGLVENGLGFNGFNGNPIGQGLHSGKREYTTNFYENSLTLAYDVPFIKGLSLKGRVTHDKEFYNYYRLTTPFTYWKPDAANDTYIPVESVSTISLDRRRQERTKSTFLLSANYVKTIDKHKFEILGLVEGMEDGADWISAYREGFISEKIDKLFAGGGDNKGSNGSAWETARLGYVGRLMYNYDNRYLFKANFRYDASYNFQKSKRWGLFPAFSAGWRLSEEDFMKELKWLDNFKVRVSYGKVGNDRISSYQYLSGFQFSGGQIFDGSLAKGISPSRLANENVTWETATDYGIGVDFGILQKIDGSVELFKKRTEDILRPRNAAVPSTFGASLPDENLGIVENHGVEVTLNYNDKLGDIFWGASATFTNVKSEVIEMQEAENVADQLKSTGRPFGQKFGYVSAGLFQSQEEIDNWHIQDGGDNSTIQPGDIKYLDISGPEGKKDGKVDSYDRTHIGKSDTPEIVYGLNLYAGYKGLKISANFQGVTECEKQIQFAPFVNDQNTPSRLTDSWSEKNKDAKYPRLGIGMPKNNGKYSTFWLMDASYLKLKNLTVSYDLKNDYLKKAKISNLRLFVTGTNLFTWSDIDFRDPEGPSNGNPFYPPVKTYLAGINITF